MRVPFSRIATFLLFAILGCAFGYFILFRYSVRLTSSGQDLQFQFLDACRWGDVRTMEQLYAKGVSPTALADNVYSEPSGPPILEAAEFARPDAVKWLLDHGATWDVTISLLPSCL